MKKLYFIVLLFLFSWGNAQHVGINATGASPDPKAMLDIASTTSGLLIPRMTTVQRDLITSPPTGLQIYNLTTNTLDVYRGTRWASFPENTASNLVYVYSLADLPAPTGNAITLDATKMYIFSGIVNISPNYLELNGAGMRGTDPAKDGVLSTVSGGVLRSTGVSVYMENLAVIPASGSTKAYDFADATGTQYCNIFSGCSVVEIGIPSLGVGQVSGFAAITILKNFWSCADGIKVTGNVGKFASAFNFITSLTTGAGIEFLAGLNINDIDLSNNYFIYNGQVGIKVNAGSMIDHGRLTTNMFRGVTNNLLGINSYSFGWQMVQNTDIPNTRALCFEDMTNNPTSTTLTTQGVFYKIAGTTTMVKEQRFTAASNRMTYTGKEPMTARVLAVLGARAPNNNSDFSIAIAKNGVVIGNPYGSMALAGNGTSFQITLATEVDLVTNDYIEVWIRKNNTNNTAVIVDELQFRVTD
jgi:hypothetical protein